MTYITQLTGRGSVQSYRFLTMLLAGCALLALQSSAVQAQWSTGTNINNTNSGTVSVGTTNPGGDKLIVSGNTISGNISSHTQLYSGYDAQANVVMELGYGTATANLTPYSTFILSKNLTSANQLLGTFNFANRSIADGSDKRIAQVAAFTDTTTNSGALTFHTMNAGTPGERIRINSIGNVGIGTATPGELVHIRKDQNAATHLMLENHAFGSSALADLQVKNDLNHLAQFGLYSSTTTTAGALASGNAYAYTTSPAMVIMANNGTGIIKFATGGLNERMRIDASGNVGIGTATPNPSYRLDVNGGANVTGNLNATGAITGGTINAKYQDVAEWVQSSQQLSAGTVVVLDHTKSNQVIASSQAYDTRVAGVISLQPGITLGEDGAGKVLVATTGRVKVKVDATAGPIQVGDLLVTSDKEGVARKSEPLSLGGVQIHRPGTLIGKALEPLNKGTGEILVLLSLQ